MYGPWVRSGSLRRAHSLQAAAGGLRVAGMVLLDPVDATPFEAESVLPALRYAAPLVGP